MDLMLSPLMLNNLISTFIGNTTQTLFNHGKAFGFYLRVQVCKNVDKYKLFL
jgi:hypothetical protein